ncbi:hypothetical protein FHS74_001124 [Nitrospirillum iridis]|uniref:Uncharacterized protein n=1 Tax=Nitrospirillum iridis TaxID=765888 RepID=A0A7X0AUX6_9PROT|nr:hypothetical protein [Nitrospirillum iridis]
MVRALRESLSHGTAIRKRLIAAASAFLLAMFVMCWLGSILFAVGCFLAALVCVGVLTYREFTVE